MICERVENARRITTIKQLKVSYDHFSKADCGYLSKSIRSRFGKDNFQEVLDGATKEDILSLISRRVEYLKRRIAEKRDDERLTPSDYSKIRQYVDVVNLIFSERDDLYIQYSETELYHLHKVVCPICGAIMSFRELSKFNIYVCPNQCDSVVSCHPHTALPAGIVATTKLRTLRKKLHCVTEQVFQGSKKMLYSFLSHMLDRSFDDFYGHIGSMNEAECTRILNLFTFLRERSKHFSELRKHPEAEAEYLLEENFLQCATHQEMQAYYVLATNGFSIPIMAKRMNLYENKDTFHKLLVSLVKKGIPIKSWNMESKAISEDMKDALYERYLLSEKLLSFSEVKKKSICII